MKISRPSLRRLALRSPAALLVVLAAACTSDDAAPPTSVRPPGGDGELAMLQCQVQVATGELSCVPGSGLAEGSGASFAQQTVGGQGTYVRLANSGNSQVGTVLSMNVTVQNLANLAMGTSDGAARHADGVRVFFYTDPHATSGAGPVTVANATGTAMFTSAGQSYFQYGGSIGGTDQPELGADGVLASAETSSARSWQFNVDPGVTAFGFAVMVRTETGPGTLASVAPQVTGTSAATLVPGQAVTLTGTNFNPTPASNTVRIGGVAATVTGGGATSLNVVVPCVLTGNVGVQVEQGGMAGAPLTRPLQAPQRTLAVGQSVVVTGTAEVGCNEITPSGVNSRYVVAVYNTSSSPGANSAVQISGDPAGAGVPGPVEGVSPSLSLQPSPRMASALSTGEDRHLELLEKNRAEYQRLRARFANDARMRPSRDVVYRDPVAPPATRTFHVSNVNVASICSNYYVATGTRVYYNGKIAIYEDDATPAGLKAAASPTMQDYYNRIGDQFNADMEPIIRNNFGDLMRRDAITDNNGVLVAFFTPLINNNFPGVAGFVVSCDQYPDADAAEPAVGGPYVGTANQNGASNFGEVFYAYQPTSTGTGFGTVGTPDYWYRTIRSTFIHESKHVASMAARVANSAPVLEDAWLEEGTARHAEELWGRQAVDGMAWKGNTGYGSAANPINLYCDARSTGACATTRRPAAIMQRHFFSLYTQMAGTNGALLSPFGKTPYDNQSYFYAISWSLARYAIDRYGASDAAFLTALTQSTTAGTANLAARAGVPLDQLMGGWALSLAADDYPGLAAPGVDIQMPTWNFRDIYAGIQADGFSSVAYPLVPTALSYGAFSAVNVAELYGGGVRWFQFSGVQLQAQLVRLRGSGGGALPSTVRVAIARVQ
jgi:hypothetical protein